MIYTLFTGWVWWSVVMAAIVFVVVIVPLALMLIFNAVWGTIAELWSNLKEYWNEQANS